MTFRKVILIFACLSFAFYVFQVNSLTADAYAASLLEKQFQTLNDETKNLEHTAAKTLSAAQFANLAEVLKFEKVQNVTYIQIVPETVAKGFLRQ